jgi:PTH1 family peptidyl-tRNA hydrolase
MADIFDLFAKIAPKPQGPITHLIVGLGNPGATYEGTRHNAGFIAVDRMAEGAGVRIDRAKFDALVAEGMLGEVRVLFMKPQTFMNLSGKAVKAAADFYKIPPERILVLVDDISFAPGNLRIRRSGSAGGHNGLKSIEGCLSSKDYPRFKLGVGQKPTPEYDLVDWVLGKFPDEGIKKIEERLPDICDSCFLMVESKIDDAMCKYSKGSK